MKSVLVSWIGQNDLNAVSDNPEKRQSHGPVLATLENRDYSDVILLYNYEKKKVQPYLDWLLPQTGASVQASYVKLKSPIDFRDIHIAVDSKLKEIFEIFPDRNIEVLITPGTPAMQAVWIILGKARYDVKFIQSSKEQGVQVADIPFDIAADFLPATKSSLTTFATGSDVIDEAFEKILTKDKHMNMLKTKATILAKNDLPVLVLGETGTGKEEFAKSIHKASSRYDKPFISVNCGAIQKELMRSELFGYVKGAFTGALTNKKGLFEAANGGTLFLDEFGDMPQDAQVGLLRALQSQEIVPVGGSDEIKVDVRIIAATNKDLLKEIHDGNFREDLFFRVAVGILELPPLRDRGNADLTYLSEMILEEINKELKFETPKKLGANAMNVIKRHLWTGNFRELKSTLLRACLWADSAKISGSDIESALIRNPHSDSEILGRDISHGFDIESVIGEVVRHYILRALDEAHNNKSKAAKLLGFTNYQRLDTWMKKYSEQ